MSDHILDAMYPEMMDDMLHKDYSVETMVVRDIVHYLRFREPINYFLTMGAIPVLVTLSVSVSLQWIDPVFIEAKVMEDMKGIEVKYLGDYLDPTGEVVIKILIKPMEETVKGIRRLQWMVMSRHRAEVLAGYEKGLSFKAFKLKLNGEECNILRNFDMHLNMREEWSNMLGHPIANVQLYGNILEVTYG